MRNATSLAIDSVERGIVPDALVRAGIRRFIRERLSAISADDVESAAATAETFAAQMASDPIALLTHKANAQHYEVPAAFFASVLGPHRKYSSCWWPAGVDTLESAEAAALEATCSRAEVENGQNILELGCGWGSLSLWMAEHYPRSQITAVSNSNSQREWITAAAVERGLSNLEVITCDMIEFDPGQRFDRIVSVEMFEHMRNWLQLFGRVRSWLVPTGRFFMHVFVHRTTPYAFIERDAADWMTRHFFGGGMMPSDDLPLRFQDDLRLLRRWRWDGRHYERTANAWLANMDARRSLVRPLLVQTYGKDNAALWWTRWRVFFMSCAELFGHERGQTWFVSHYLFGPRS